MNIIIYIVLLLRNRENKCPKQNLQQRENILVQIYVASETEPKIGNNVTAKTQTYKTTNLFLCFVDCSS